MTDWEKFEDWMTRTGADILIIIAVFLVILVVFRAVFPKIARAAILRGASAPDAEMEKRADTIVSVMDRTAGLGVLVIAAITILYEVDVNITAIVTGLGITGLALALGAQALVRDGINGIFLLAEDQYRTGDVVKIAEVTGTVESITLRRTIIRDDDGVVHSVPNGAISVVSNYTRDFAYVNVRVQVAYGEDIKRATSVIERVGSEMLETEEFGALITEAPAVRRVESVGEGGVTVLVGVRTRPGARWDVAGELRRRLAEAFVAEGIRVPFAELKAEDETQIQSR